MKKIFALVLVSCLTLGMLAGCGDAAGSTSFCNVRKRHNLRIRGSDSGGKRCEAF